MILLSPNTVLANDTFTLNAADLGGAIANLSILTRLTVGNCILWGDSSEIDGIAPVSVLYSDVMGGFSGPGKAILNVDPRFVPNRMGDYYLLPNSPCVDAGSATVPGFVPRGIQGRPQDVSAPDMGRTRTLPAERLGYRHLVVHPRIEEPLNWVKRVTTIPTAASHSIGSMKALWSP